MLVGATMGDDAGLDTPSRGVVTGAVLAAADDVQVSVAPQYSLNDSAQTPQSRPLTDDEEDEDTDDAAGPHGERLLSNRPRRSSFDVALNEDPLFHATHPVFRKLRHAFRKAWGLLLMIMASAMLSTVTLIVSLLSTYFSAWELGAWRLLGQWLCSLVVVKLQKHSLRFEQRAMKAMVLRCFAGLGSMLCLYLAIRHMAMANATIIRYTSPAMVAFLAKLWFGEPFTKVHMACCVLSFLGAVFVAQPSFIFGEHTQSSSGNEKGAGGGTALQHYIAWGFSISAAIFAALAFLSLRALKKVHPMVTTHWFSCLGFFIVGTVAFFTGLNKPPKAMGWVMLVSTGVLGFFGQWAMCRSLQIERAGPATMMRYLDVAFAFVFQVTIEHQSTNLWPVMGAMMVVLCAVLVAFQRCFFRRKAIKRPVPDPLPARRGSRVSRRGSRASRSGSMSGGMSRSGSRSGSMSGGMSRSGSISH